MKRLDPTFGSSTDRVVNVRNAFLVSGTINEGIKFFHNEIGHKIFYGKFKTILELCIEALPRRMGRKIERILAKIDQGLYFLSLNQ